MHFLNFLLQVACVVIALNLWVIVNDNKHEDIINCLHHILCKNSSACTVVNKIQCLLLLLVFIKGKEDYSHRYNIF